MSFKFILKLFKNLIIYKKSKKQAKQAETDKN